MILGSGLFFLCHVAESVTVVDVSCFLLIVDASCLLIVRHLSIPHAVMRDACVHVCVCDATEAGGHDSSGDGPKSDPKQRRRSFYNNTSFHPVSVHDMLSERTVGKLRKRLQATTLAQ